MTAITSEKFSFKPTIYKGEPAIQMKIKGYEARALYMNEDCGSIVFPTAAARDARLKELRKRVSPVAVRDTRCEIHDLNMGAGKCTCAQPKQLKTKKSTKTV